MTENTEKTTGTTEGKSNDQLEKAKQDTLLHLLGMVKTFADTDMAITKDLELFLSALADYAKKPGGYLFRWW